MINTGRWLDGTTVQKGPALYTVLFSEPSDTPDQKGWYDAPSIALTAQRPMQRAIEGVTSCDQVPGFALEGERIARR